MDKRILTGRLGKDAEVKTRKDGTKYLSYALANSDHRNADGEKIAKWFNCTQRVYGEGSEKLAKYLNKGKVVLVQGMCEEKVGDDGSVVVFINVTELEFLGGDRTIAKSENKPAEKTKTKTPTKASAAKKSLEEIGFETNDDDIF